MATQTTRSSQTKRSLSARWHGKIIEKAKSKQAFAWFNGISFLESSVFPFPPDWIMIPMILANKADAWRLAFWGTVSSVLGGIVGYSLGAFLWNTVGVWIIDLYSLQSAMVRFQEGFANWGFWIIVFKGATPIPYKLVTIASGMAGYSFSGFVIASVIARAFRFYLLAALLWRFGDQANKIMERYFLPLFLLSLLFIALGVYTVIFVCSK